MSFTCINLRVFFSVEIFESIPPEINDDISIELIKLEDEPQTQSSISISSFHTSPSFNTNTSLPTIIPNSHCIPPIPTTTIEENNWPTILSINPTKKRPKPKICRRLQNHSNDITQYPSVSNILPVSARNSIQVN